MKTDYIASIKEAMQLEIAASNIYETILNDNDLTPDYLDVISEVVDTIKDNYCLVACLIGIDTDQDTLTESKLSVAAQKVSRDTLSDTSTWSIEADTEEDVSEEDLIENIDEFNKDNDDQVSLVSCNGSELTVLYTTSQDVTIAIARNVIDKIINRRE